MSWLSLLNLLKPFVAPFLKIAAVFAAYFKGRNEGKKNEQARNEKRANEIIADGLNAKRDAANSGELHDKHFRD